MLRLAETIDPVAEQAMMFAHNILQSRSAAFYEVTPDLTQTNYILRGVSLDFHRRYLEGMGRYDPLQIGQLARRGKPVARLAEEWKHVPSADYLRYRRFASAFDVNDMLEFIFRRDGRIFAGISVAWPDERSIPESALGMAQPIHAYLEFNLRHLTRASETAEAPALRLEKFGLTRREVEVSELLCCGRTNREIGECLSIGLATVKTHVVNIFCKLGVETRTAAVAVLTRAP
jgi:DNA-binding CsgD family transcriptional regulator